MPYARDRAWRGSWRCRAWPIAGIALDACNEAAAVESAPESLLELTTAVDPIPWLMSPVV